MADTEHKDDLAQIEEDANGGVTVSLGGKGGDDTRTGSDGRRQKAEERVSADENVEALKQQLANERRLRSEAQRQSQQFDARRVQAERQSVSGQLDLIETSISSTSKEKNSLKSELSAAHAAGDFDKVADIQERMNDSQIRLNDLVRGRDALKQRADMEQHQARQAPEQRRSTHADPVEAFIEQAGVSQRSADWLRDHPDCITDTRKQRQTARAHEDAVYEGILPDTRAYFDFIEEKLGLNDARRGDDGRNNRNDRGERRPDDRGRDALSGNAAPPSRGGGDGRGAGSKNSIYLSPLEKETADELKISYAEYARQKQALQKEGKLR